MRLISFNQLAIEMNVTPANITYWLKLGILDGALVSKDGRKKPLVDSVKAKKLIKQFKDPAFGKNSPSEQVKSLSKKSNNSDSNNLQTQSSSSGKNEAMKASQSKTEIDLELLFEIIDIVRQCLKEREEFFNKITRDLINIAKTGNMRKLRAEILKRLNYERQNVWLGFTFQIEERYDVDLW